MPEVEWISEVFRAELKSIINMASSSRQKNSSQQQQQQQQCIYLKKYKVYNTLCPANSYNALVMRGCSL